jgi:alpha-ketoglutarate-dependent taurine dioxygenase
MSVVEATSQLLPPGCRAWALDPERAFPLVIELTEPRSAEAFAAWYAGSFGELGARLLSHGALLFRGTGIASAADFDRLLAALPLSPLSYASGNSPRIRLGARVYTSTEHPADRTIPIHNELSYSHVYPAQVLFLCVTPATSGGETPLADSAEIIRRIPREIVDEFEQKQVRYIRNLHGGVGMGPSWQDTFETSDRGAVADFLRRGGADFRWKDDGGLWMSQVRPAVLRHPFTGVKAWFNQVDEFHPSVNGAEIYEALLEMVDNQVEHLAMFAMFGDGSEIPLGYLESIRRAIAASTVTFPWREGDLLVLDNYRIAHGRGPFTGPRRVLVSMLCAPSIEPSGSWTKERRQSVDDS